MASYICPHCGGQTHHYDKTKRKIQTTGGKMKTIEVERRRCYKCGQTHRVLPYELIPFKHYEKEIIFGVLEGFITPETLGYEDYPSEMTMNRWLHDEKLNREFIDDEPHNM